MADNRSMLYWCCMDNHPPRFTSAFPMQATIAGATYLSDDRRAYYIGENFTLDDSGDNISCLNPWFGDLTVLYWAWKNTNHEYLGVCQYRRPWNEGGLASSEENVLYVPPAAIFASVEQQYMDCHSAFNAPAFSRELASKGKIPLSYEMVDNAWKQQRFHGCNMARGPKHLFDKYCEIVFATMMPLWEEHQDLCKTLTGYQQRSIAFAAERLITAIVLNGDYFFGAGKLKEARIDFTG